MAELLDGRCMVGYLGSGEYISCIGCWQRGFPGGERNKLIKRLPQTYFSDSAGVQKKKKNHRVFFSPNHAYHRRRIHSYIPEIFFSILHPL